MSTMSDSHADDTDRIPWDELTTGEQRVAQTIAHVHGVQTFNRPDLFEEVVDSETIGDVIDDKERVLTSLKYTRLLNDLVYDEYLVKEFQGGTNPIILDVEYDSDRDIRNAAPWGDTSALYTLVSQVCDREGINRDLLQEVDNKYDFIEVKNKVNGVVGRVVLQPYADPSKYRFSKETYSLVSAKNEKADVEE